MSEVKKFPICGNDHNDRSKMTAVFKGDALVTWICLVCIKLNGMEAEFNKWLKGYGYTI